MDLWFTVVYMMDDFGPRSLVYEQYAYRQLTEQIAYAQKRYGTDPEWKDWLEDTQRLSDMMETQVPITAEQKADPKTIASWPHPHAITEKPSTSQDFLKFLHELLYGDISMETHLKPAGLMTVAGILLTDTEIMPEQVCRTIEDRTIHQYKFRSFCRTVIALLGIVSEIELHCKLGNKEQAVKVWERLSHKNADARDVYEARYKLALA